MASIYKLKPGNIFTVPNEDKTTQCKLCFEIAKPEDGCNLGPLYQYGRLLTNTKTRQNEDALHEEDMEVYCAHYFCLLFCSALCQRGEDDSEGIKGFLPEDILKEWRRASRLKCFRCNKKYATVGCSSKKCRRVYHLPCAIRDKGLTQFCQEFRLFCGDHRLQQVIYNSPDAQGRDASRECGICSEELRQFEIETVEQQMQNIWTPCCNKWFHKDCIQQFAMTSGYFFKCPLCNNKDIFEAEMKSFGVYVPEQDASWETHNNGALFEDLLERHGRCDAMNCICPDGREVDEDYTIWEIILCWYCGAQGIHVQCGDLPLSKEIVKWKCNDCKEILKKMPKRTLHKYKKVQRRKSRKDELNCNKRILNDALKNTRIVVDKDEESHICNDESSGTGSKIAFHLENIGMLAHFNLCPKYEVPQPVLISNVPWDDKDPALDRLAAEARQDHSLVKMNRMELPDERYSVYTIWRPESQTERKRNHGTSEGITILAKDKIQLYNGPITPLKDSNQDACIKTRSPSVPKDRTHRVFQSSPRSHSLPSKLNKNSSTECKKLMSNLPTPVAKNLDQSPVKFKYSKTFGRKEALTVLKSFGGKIEKSKKIPKEVKNINVTSNLSIPKNINSEKVNAGEVMILAEKQSNEEVIMLSKKHSNEEVIILSDKQSNMSTNTTRQKRKLTVDSPSKSYKKRIKGDHLFCQSKLNFEDTLDSKASKNELKNKKGDLAKKSNFHYSPRKTLGMKSEPQKSDIYKENTISSKPKTQKNILQYFQTD